MERVAASEFKIFPHLGFMQISLTGEPEFIGSAGDGDTIDSVLAYYGLESMLSVSDAWICYQSALLNHPGSYMKAWLHWNGECYNTYLKCAQSTDGSTGFASHAMPYIQR